MKNATVKNFEELLAVAANLAGKRVAVVLPGNAETFDAIEQAHLKLGARFTLIGDREVIEHALSMRDLQAGACEVVHEPEVFSALRTSIDCVREGKADILMKGSIDTSTMMKAVLHEEHGLRTGRLLSDIFILEYAPREDNKF